MLITGSMAYFFQIHARQNQVQLPGADVLVGCVPLGHFKGAPLQPLLVQGEAVLIPKQDLHPSALAAEKDKKFAAERVFAQLIAHHTAQAVDALAHIGPAAIQVAAVKARNRKHQPTSSRSQLTGGSP